MQINITARLVFVFFACVVTASASYYDEVRGRNLLRVLPKDTISVDRNTIVFFSVTEQELNALSDPDLSEVISDFEEDVYSFAASANMKIIYTASRYFRIKCSGALIDRTKISTNIVGEVQVNSKCEIKTIEH